MGKRFQSLAEFYPYYLTEHSDPTCRIMHYIGTTLVIGMLVFGLLQPAAWKFIAIPFFGYGFAWIGHFVFEKNKPATFQYPLYSLASDFKMFFDFLTGKVDKKLADAKQQFSE